MIYLDDAIEAIEEITWYHQNCNNEMVSGANSSEHQPWYKSDDIYMALERVPSAQPEIISTPSYTVSAGEPIEYAPIVRCKDCKHNYGLTHSGEYNPEDIVCDYFETDGLTVGDYCSYGERRTDE